MSTGTMTSKGQITVPADVRRELGLEPGVQVEFVRVGPGEYRLVPKTQTLKQLKASLPRPEQAVTVEQMHAAVTAAASGSGNRGNSVPPS